MTGVTVGISGTEERRLRVFREFTDAALRGEEDEYDPGSPLRTLRNSQIVAFVENQTIITERSPPVAEIFGEVVKKASSVTLGAYLGWKTSSDNPVLLWLTVPAGIIVVGSAVGIARGFEKGLNKSIQRLFK